MALLVIVFIVVASQIIILVVLFVRVVGSRGAVVLQGETGYSCWVFCWLKLQDFVITMAKPLKNCKDEHGTRHCQ